MNAYSDIIGLSSQALMSSMFWGITYFIVLFVPLYVYLKKFTSDKEQNSPTPFIEIVGQALILQLGALFMFAIIGTFLQYINIGSSDLKPEKAFLIFFGSSNELIDQRWGGYLSSLHNDSAALTRFGSEAKGVAFLANKYIGIIYRLFIIFLFFMIFYFLLINFLRKFKDGEQQVNVFSKMYSAAVTSVIFVMIVIIHSMIAASLPSWFGIPFDSISVNFISYFQSVIADIFYN